MTAIQSSSQQLVATTTGDLCIAECQVLNGKKIIFAAVYISVNQKLDDIIQFLHRQLLVYSHRGAALLGSEEDKTPLILGGDFNVNFASDDSIPLIDFLSENFSLLINNDPKISTTKSGTTIDAIFTRNLENIESRTYVSYFSYHKALVTTVPM